MCQACAVICSHLLSELELVSIRQFVSASTTDCDNNASTDDTVFQEVIYSLMLLETFPQNHKVSHLFPAYLQRK